MNRNKLELLANYGYISNNFVEIGHDARILTYIYKYAEKSFLFNDFSSFMEKMKKKAEISVIIPVYNRAWCIAEAMDSVLSQTIDTFELIIVDDGSTDSTEDILKKYLEEHENIRVINQENKGVSAARNTGILNSNGNYIAFLDSDDLWEPGKLQAQMDFFNANPGCLVCQTDEIWIRNGKRINPKFRHKKQSGDIFIPSLSLCLVSPSAVMMKREFFEKTGVFDESMAACEDYDLWLRGALNLEFGLVDEPYVIKTGGHDDQLSSMPLLDKLRIYSIDKILTMGVDCEVRKKACIEKLVEKCRIYMNGCKKRSKWEEYNIYEALMLHWEDKY